MRVFGIIPFSNFKEKCKLINDLKKEVGKLNKKVRISVENNLITYEYYS